MKRILVLVGFAVASGCTTIPSNWKDYIPKDAETVITNTIPDVLPKPEPNPVPAGWIDLYLTDSQDEVNRLQREGKTVGLMVERNVLADAGKNRPETVLSCQPQMIVLRPDPATFHIGHEREWVPVCQWADRQCPKAIQCWMGNGGTHPTCFRLIKDQKRQMVYWVFDDEGKGTDGDIRKLNTFWAINQGMGYKMIVYRYPKDPRKLGIAGSAQ